MCLSLDQLRRRRALEGNEDGFTLIELLIVLVIIGILAGIVVFAVQSLTSNTSHASCSADFKSIQVAAEAYKAQMGSYPAGGNLTDALPALPAPLTGVGQMPGGTNATSMLVTGSESPTNPGHDSHGNPTFNVQSPSGSPVGPWLKDTPGNPDHYQFWVSNDGKGTILVLDATGRIVGPASGGGNGVSDCNYILK